MSPKSSAANTASAGVLERRQHQRFAANFEARITSLCDDPLNADPKTGRSKASSFESCQVVDFSQAGVCVLSPLQFLPQALVQLEIADSVIIGRAAYSKSEGSRFRTGIAVEQVWLGGTEQGQNLQSVLLEAMPATPGVLAADAYLG